MITADWQAHGPINVPTSAVAPAPQPAMVQPAVQTSGTAQVTPAVVATPHVEPEAAAASNATIPSESVADAAKREKQHKACLELAKDNTNIVCK
jgi:hypothetical protein